MEYKLFLDDEREPVDTFYDDIPVMISRSYSDSIRLMERYSCPVFISFDHDLGEEKRTGYELVKYMIQKDLDDCGKFIPEGFDFFVHSQNPVGGENIKMHLDNYLKYRTCERK